MAKKTKTAGKKKSPRKRAADARKRLTPAKQKRGLAGGEVRLEMTSGRVAPLVAEVEAAGGTTIGAYREPLSGRPILLATPPPSRAYRLRSGSSTSAPSSSQTWPWWRRWRGEGDRLPVVFRRFVDREAQLQ